MEQNADFEEKTAVGENVLDSPASEAEPRIVKDWDTEEGSVRRKVDWTLIPVLALGFFALQMDRGNVSAILTSTITKDLDINTNQINIGTQLVGAAIVIAEIPSNLIMQRLGPRVWLAGQLFAWGLVATFQAFVQSYSAYLATRVLLGLCEGGFIPGALYYLSTWYKKDEISLRTSLFFYGQMFASATTSLISGGLLSLDGTGGLEGWRWIFLIEGVITLFVGIIFVLCVPPEAGDGRAWIFFGRGSYYTERQSHIIRDRVLLDDPLKAKGHLRITGSDIWHTVRQPRILQHFFITLVSMSGFQGLSQYTPSLIRSLGFSAVKANALNSVPVYCALIWLTALAYASDRLNHRGPFVLLTLTWNVISYACVRTMSPMSSKWHRYGVLAVANVTYGSMHVLNVAWLSYYCRTPQERSVAMAFIQIAANCSGISGSQIFRTEDAPKYLQGLTAICVLEGVSWVQTAALGLQYYYVQRKAARSKRVQRADEQDEEHGRVQTEKITA